MRVLVPNDNQTTLRITYYVCPICLLGFFFIYSFRLVLIGSVALFVC
jgi:hypothetical protein